MKYAPYGRAGVLAVACVEGESRAQHGKSHWVGLGNSNEESVTIRLGPFGVAEWLVVPGKSGNADGGKGP